MKQTWTVPGTYANWTMTLTTTPADDSTRPFVDDWSPGPLDRIGQYFRDAVQFVECLRVLDEHIAMKASNLPTS